MSWPSFSFRVAVTSISVSMPKPCSWNARFTPGTASSKERSSSMALPYSTSRSPPSAHANQTDRSAAAGDQLASARLSPEAPVTVSTPPRGSPRLPDPGPGTPSRARPLPPDGLVDPQPPPQILAQQRPGPVEDRTDRPDGAAGEPGDLLGRQALSVLEQHDRAVVGGQRLQRPEDGGPALRFERRPLGVEFAGAELQPLPARRTLQQEVQGERRLAAADHQAFVRGHPVDPGPQAGLGPEPVQVLDGLHQGRLGHVLRVLGVPAQMPGQPVQVVPVGRHRFRPEHRLHAKYVNAWGAVLHARGTGAGDPLSAGPSARGLPSSTSGRCAGSPISHWPWPIG